MWTRPPGRSWHLDSSSSPREGIRDHDARHHRPCHGGGSFRRFYGRSAPAGSLLLSHPLAAPPGSPHPVARPTSPRPPARPRSLCPAVWSRSLRRVVRARSPCGAARPRAAPIATHSTSGLVAIQPRSVAWHRRPPLVRSHTQEMAHRDLLDPARSVVADRAQGVAAHRLDLPRGSWERLKRGWKGPDGLPLPILHHRRCPLTDGFRTHRAPDSRPFPAALPVGRIASSPDRPLRLSWRPHVDLASASPRPSSILRASTRSEPARPPR